MGTKAEILKINDKSYTVRYNDPADNDNKEAEIDIKAIAPGKQVLLITGTNKDKETLNDIIRPELVKRSYNRFKRILCFSVKKPCRYSCYGSGFLQSRAGDYY